MIISKFYDLNYYVFVFSPPKPKPAPRKPKDSDVASSYAEEVNAGQIRPPWQMLKTNDALPPRALTVTSVTQSHDLQVIERSVND